MRSSTPFHRLSFCFCEYSFRGKNLKDALALFAAKEDTSLILLASLTETDGLVRIARRMTELSSFAANKASASFKFLPLKYIHKSEISNGEKE